jgi:hypothetical protein
MSGGHEPTYRAEGSFVCNYNRGLTPLPTADAHDVNGDGIGFEKCSSRDQGECKGCIM